MSGDRRPPGTADLVDACRVAGIRDERLLAAIAAVPRAAFVPSELVDRAYIDEPVRITHDQVTTQPSLVAKMLEALALDGDEKVLEVGTGFGYQTALLSALAREVWSIELWLDMTDAARASLDTIGADNVSLLVGDGTRGVPDQAPFDAIVVAAAFPAVPAPLADQLARGGRLVQPIGPGGREIVWLFERDGNSLVRKRSVTRAYFVKLFGRHGYPLDQAPAEA